MHVAATAATAAAAAAETLAGKANKFWPKIPGAKSTFHADARVNLPSREESIQTCGLYKYICYITYRVCSLSLSPSLYGYIVYLAIYIYIYSYIVAMLAAQKNVAQILSACKFSD